MPAAQRKPATGRQRAAGTPAVRPARRPATRTVAPAKAAKRPRTAWRCPDCGQGFSARGARHSCAVRDAEELFATFPQAVRIHKAVLKAVQAFGPVESAATKSQVSYRNRTRFAWVWVPAMHRRQRASAEAEVFVSFDLPRRLASLRVREAVEPRPGRFTHHVHVASAKDLDGELRRWLREAFEAAA